LKKIAFIVQRYGLEVNGGAEYLCRLLAERLTDRYEVEVLTSCAVEYVTWANAYPAGTHVLNGVRVRRFPVAQERQEVLFVETTRRLQKWMRPEERRGLARLKSWGRYLSGKVQRYSDEWARAQGPYVPELIGYLRAHQAEYTALIFFTYLYYPTIEGLKVAPRKSILVPTAHDEPPIYLPVFRRLFSRPRAIFYNMPSEKRFVEAQFGNASVYSDFLGVGIDLPAETAAPAAPVPAEPYLLYVGRIDPAKGCDVLFDYFIRYQRAHPGAFRLVLVGQAFMPIPEHPAIEYRGFVDEATKVALLRAARALVMPSPYESLSMVTLESFACGVPVVANGQCEVLRDHLETSRAGFLYTDADRFADALHQVRTADPALLAERGRQYVRERYTWAGVLARFTKGIAYVAGTH
jgi:glycosyltransferase involved in cell wall biosynthesis